MEKSSPVSRPRDLLISTALRSNVTPHTTHCGDYLIRGATGNNGQTLPPTALCSLGYRGELVGYFCYRCQISY